MRNGYAHVTTLGDALRVARERSAKTLLFDVEPLVAYWDSGQQALDQGLARVLDEASVVPGVLVVCFSTNSLRRPSASLVRPGIRVVYLAAARKPFRLTPYQDFPAPGALIGDQVLTDGILARRLGYDFVHCEPELAKIPPGPRLMNEMGRLALPLLARRPDHQGE
jgi:predicted HAD superfamily phosphohydrolase YqeG